MTADSRKNATIVVMRPGADERVRVVSGERLVCCGRFFFGLGRLPQVLRQGKVTISEWEFDGHTVAWEASNLCWKLFPIPLRCGSRKESDWPFSAWSAARASSDSAVFIMALSATGCPRARFDRFRHHSGSGPSRYDLIRASSHGRMLY